MNPIQAYKCARFVIDVEKGYYDNTKLDYIRIFLRFLRD